MDRESGPLTGEQDDCLVRSGDIAECLDHLGVFVARYQPFVTRSEQRTHVHVYLEGLLSGLERKSIEPIATAHGLYRRPLQHFVGAGKWSDDDFRTELRSHVASEIGHKDAIFVIDGSGFEKSGPESVGAERQWCGRLGKVENCQVGVFVAYAAAGGHAAVHRRLYLPEDRAADRPHRAKTHVPDSTAFAEKWRIADDLLREAAPGLPHAWVAGDDEFGRAAEFRALLRARGERYVLDVPCNTLVRDLERRRPPRKKGGRGPKRKVPFVQAQAWAQALPAERWTRMTVRAGEAGPIVVDAAAVRVSAKCEGRVGPEERLLVVRTVGAKPETGFHLSNAGPEVPLHELVRARSERHRIEQTFEEAKGETGMAQYEVRSWTGWHHHVTLSLLALWFLVLERRAMGEKKPGRDGPAGAAHPDRAAARAAADAPEDRRAGDRRPAADRGSADLQVA